MEKNNILGEKNQKKTRKNGIFFKKNTLQGVLVSPGSATPVYLSLAGEGPRGRQQCSAVKLIPMIIPPDYRSRTVGNGQGSGRTEGTFVDGRSGPTILWSGFFFLASIRRSV